MKDVFSKSKRSEVMSMIRSENTKIERMVFRELRKRSIYFQRHYKKITGKPDIALPRQKKAVFIDGDFWHGYDYKTLKFKLRKKFWREKIERNIANDQRNNRKLRKEGWKVLRIWEHQLRKDFSKIMDRVEKFLKT